MSTQEAALQSRIAEVSARIRERRWAEHDDYFAHTDAATEKTLAR